MMSTSKTRKNDLINTFAQSIGLETARELLSDKIKAASLEDKSRYTEEEVTRICTELAKEGGLIRIIAQSFLVQLERKRSQEQTLLLDNIETQIWYLTDVETYGTANRAHAEFFGIRKKDFEDKHLSDILTKEEAAGIISVNKEVFNGKKQVRTEEWITNSKGEIRLLAITRTPKLDDRGDVEYVICAAEDITEHKLSDEELKFKNALLEAQTETSADGILVVDPEGKVLLYNNRFVKMWNIPQEIVEARDDQKLLQYNLKQLKDPEQFLSRIDYLYTHKDEQSRDEIEFLDGKLIERYSAPLLGSDDSHYGRIWYFRDITTRKQAEEALRKSEARYRAVVEDQTEMINRYTPDFTLTFVNEAYCRIYDKTSEELIGQSVLDIVSEEVRKSLKKHISSLSYNNPVGVNEERIVMPDGEIHWHQWTNRAIFDQQGEIVEYQGVGRNITERKQAEEALRASEARYRAVVEDQTEMINRYTPDFTLTFVNDAFCQARGKNPEELIGGNLLDELYMDDKDIFVGQISALSKNKPLITVEHPFPLPNGEMHWERWTDRAIFDQEGELIEYQGVGRDITQQKWAEEALQKAHQELTAYTKRLERRNLEMTILSDMGDLLQSCREMEEAHMVIADYIEKLFPGQSGALYIASESGNYLEPVVIWGDSPPPEEAIQPDTCWSVRHGRAHSVASFGYRLRCQHVAEVEAPGEFQPYLCVSMSAQGELQGMLHLRINAGLDIEYWEQLSNTAADRFSLALSNIKLRAGL